VVDEENVLVGMITVDDVIDVIEEETTRDMLKMAGTSESETLTHSAFKIAGIRLPWLLAAFIGGLAATAVIGTLRSDPWRGSGPERLPAGGHGNGR
jgi:magnesium transporter